MEISTEREGTLLVAKPGGRLDSINAREFDDAMRSAISESDQVVIIDLENVSYEPFAKFGSALGRPWVSPWERGRLARILVKALFRRQSAGEPTNPVKPIATTLPGLVRAGRPRSQGSQPFPAINPAY